MGTEKTRREKIEWMKNFIAVFFREKPGEVIDRKKLLAMFALENYSSERVGQEILKLLDRTDYIQLEGDEIFNPK